MNKMQRTCSIVAIWAKNNLMNNPASAKNYDAQYVLKACIPEIILCISKNDQVPENDNEMLNLVYEADLKYRGDCSLFEICCYIIFRLDTWHVQNGLDSLRRGVFYPKVIPNLLRPFESVFRRTDLHPVLNNRLELYGLRIRTDIEEIPLLFNQLMIRATDEKKPIIRNEMSGSYPLIIAGMMDEAAIKMKLQYINGIALPTCISKLIPLYKLYGYRK